MVYQYKHDSSTDLKTSTVVQMIGLKRKGPDSYHLDEYPSTAPQDRANKMEKIISLNKLLQSDSIVKTWRTENHKKINVREA